MLLSFKCKESKKIWERAYSRKLPKDIQSAAYRKLTMLHAAISLEDLRVPPNNRLEALKGTRKGQHSIRINKQWRICFIWKGHDAINVEIVDYHK